jgi:hypothetical protein
VSNCHSFSASQSEAVRNTRSTMNVPMGMAAPTQSIKRSEQLVPQAFFPENSPSLPLRAVHFSDRPAFVPVRSDFFRIAGFAYYVSSSKTVPYSHHLLRGLSCRSHCCYLSAKEDSGAGRISLTKARGLMHPISNTPGEPQIGN